MKTYRFERPSEGERASCVKLCHEPYNMINNKNTKIIEKPVRELTAKSTQGARFNKAYFDRFL